MRRFLIGLACIVVFGIALFVFKAPILRSLGKYLIHEDQLQKADAMFVLSGGGFDRGNEAVKVFKWGYTDKIICTGGNAFVELKALNIDTLESDMTAANIRRQGIPDSLVIEIKEGTSTREESNVILGYCKINHLSKVIILSSKFHTNRINNVFRKKFKQQGIDVIIHGAPSSDYDEMLWWQSEDGLIALNNEWIKTVYYWWKY